MSNQFSYELDERQIRILMQNAELEYDESVWQKFSSIPVVDHKQSISACNRRGCKLSKSGSGIEAG